MNDIFIQGMYGFGDNIYQRAFVRNFEGAYIQTPFPELYADFNVKCVRPETKLRTQRKNIMSSEYEWHPAPRNARTIRVGYGNSELRRGSIVDAMRGVFQCEPLFDLPEVEPFRKSEQPIAVIRPVTLRREWLNSARAPLPEYVCQASKILIDKGFKVISVADIVRDQEWLEGDAPKAHEYYHNGELSFLDLLALVRTAKVVVGGVGWIVPACIASGTAGYFIQGGNGGHNAPSKITDAKVMDLSKIGWGVPDNFCMCGFKNHGCDKRITGFEEGFNEWIDATL